MMSLRDKLSGAIWTGIKEKIPEPPPRAPLTTDNLETILGALQDGVRPGPGQEDLDMLADVVCELIERRKADTNQKLKQEIRPDEWWWGGPRQAESGGAWKYDIRKDAEHFIAPDGSVLLTVSGLEMAQLRNNPSRLRGLEEQAMAAWKRNRDLRQIQQMRSIFDEATK